MTYFTIDEFDSPDLPGSGSQMNHTTLSMLDKARDIAGVPFTINSGFRTEQHNKKVGGSDTSSHLKGYAVDINCDTGPDRLKIVIGLLSAGFRRIGIAKGFIHVDNDPGKPDTIYLY